MKFLVFKQLQPEKEFHVRDRQLKQLEAQGMFPRRVPLAGGSLKGWPEIVIDQHIEALIKLSRGPS